jgi:hypothetical protein
MNPAAASGHAGRRASRWVGPVLGLLTPTPSEATEMWAAGMLRSAATFAPPSLIASFCFRAERAHYLRSARSPRKCQNATCRIKPHPSRRLT